MPFIQLPDEPSVEIFYDFYEPFDNHKRTALFLPPAVSCSALVMQYVLPKLPEVTRSFNCLSIDLRGHGRTQSPPRKGNDCFVLATDIAFLLNALQVPSVHVIANAYVAVPTAFAFALLFPSSVLSLSILGVAPLHSPPSQLDVVMELLEGWSQGEDEDWHFDSMTAMLDLAFSASLKDYRNEQRELFDWLANMWFRRIGPHRALNCFEVTAPILLSAGIKPEELASITCPVLLVQGTDDLMKGLPVAEEIRDNLTGSKEVSLEIVEGGVCYVGIANLDETAPILTKFLVSHLSLTSESTSIAFPAPPTSHSPEKHAPLTSSAYSRFDSSSPICEEMWQRCNELEGKAFVTFAEREPEAWEVGGRLKDIRRAKWRFSQRHEYERATTSRRGSVPQMIRSEGETTVVTFEEISTPLEDDKPNGFDRRGDGDRMERMWDIAFKSAEESSVKFRMDTWSWETTTGSN
ncbi:alpha/beta fold hydrolase [Sporobolomyces salmoneus]|uniref:alpha/beta fold hydrolase n=1 Tax=Sporobolomyces salmoneus TaxID=183962 RepID=UPI003173E54F